MALYDPPRNANRPTTLAELRAEAEAIFPDHYVPTRTVGLGSIGRYTPAELRKAHVAMFGLGLRK